MPMSMVSIGSTIILSEISSDSFGIKVDLWLLAHGIKVLFYIIPFDQIEIVLFFVHPLNMLLEVVEPRPYLFLIPAAVRRTLIRLLQQAYPMDTLLVSIQVVDCGEALPFSLTSRLFTHMRLFMS
jgi:hypothetical protein